VVAHLGSTRADEAALSGLNEIEHFDQCAAAWRAASEAEDDDLIALFRNNRVVMCPTLVVWDRLGRILDRSFHHDERRQWVHPCHRDIWQRYLSRQGLPHRRWRFQAAIPHLKRFMARAHAQGVCTALGMDTPFPHLIPGFSVHDELAMYVDAGLRPVEALTAATTVNARVLGIGERVGRLSAGFTADIVTIQGNPLQSIDDISNVRSTIHAGRIFTSTELLPMAQRTFDQQLDDAITRDLLNYVNAQ